MIENVLKILNTMKIIDKVNQALEKDKTNKRVFYSFEYFPARTEAGKGY